MSAAGAVPKPAPGPSRWRMIALVISLALNLLLLGMIAVGLGRAAQARFLAQPGGVLAPGAVMRNLPEERRPAIRAIQEKHREAMRRDRQESRRARRAWRRSLRIASRCLSCTARFASLRASGKSRITAPGASTPPGCAMKARLTARVTPTAITAINATLRHSETTSRMVRARDGLGGTSERSVMVSPPPSRRPG